MAKKRNSQTTDQQKESEVKEVKGAEPEKSLGKSAIERAGATRQWMQESRGMHEIHGAMEHGATELANMLLHGHPAPVYANAMSPDSPEPSNSIAPPNAEGEKKQKDKPISVEAPEEKQVTSHGVDLNDNPNESPTTVHGKDSPIKADEPSKDASEAEQFLRGHVNEILAHAPEQEPEQEQEMDR